MSGATPNEQKNDDSKKKRRHSRNNVGAYESANQSDSAQASNHSAYTINQSTNHESILCNRSASIDVVPKPMVTTISFAPETKMTYTQPKRLPLPSQTHTRSPSHRLRAEASSENSTTGNDSTAPSRTLSRKEKEINDRIIDIICVLHRENKYAGPTEVCRELFRQCNVSSWKELGIYCRNLPQWEALNDRDRTVRFYIQIFERISNLCTLHDLDQLLAKFTKVQQYNDLRLGPLQEHPEIHRIFRFGLPSSNQPVLSITTADIIDGFIKIEPKFRGNHPDVIFDELLDHLVRKFQMVKRDDLGIFCPSRKFLCKVTNEVRRDHRYQSKQIEMRVMQQLTESLEEYFNEFQEKMDNEIEYALYNKKKTPISIFNYLISIIEKHLNFPGQQTVLCGILIILRENNLLQYLFSVCIYLGTIEKPETLIEEFKKYLTEGHFTGDLSSVENLIENSDISKKDRKKLKSIKEKQQIVPRQNDEQYNEITETTTAITSLYSTFARPLRPKPPISSDDLCLELFKILQSYKTPLTISQLVEVENQLCKRHNVENFTAFNYDADSTDDSISFVKFLNEYREQIDPDGELAVYDEKSSTDDQEDIQSFVQQLSVTSPESLANVHEQHIVAIQGGLRSGHKSISTETWNVVQKALKYRFSQTFDQHHGKSIVRKATEANRQYHERPMIRFEESLLDNDGLNRLDVCPSSMNVDESQLCNLIIEAPVMIDLYKFFQWKDFFQPKYGSLPSFLASHNQDFAKLVLLETSQKELYRLPSETDLNIFEQELRTLHIRSAVGHLCASIVECGSINRFSFNVFRTSIEIWLNELRSLATLDKDQINPMKFVLEFLTYLPLLVGQSRIVDELVLNPLEKIFGNESNEPNNVRIRLWLLANAKEKSKLEFWGYMCNIHEWKNEKKWSGDINDEEPSIGQVKQLIQPELFKVKPQLIDSISLPPEPAVDNLIDETVRSHRDLPVDVDIQSAYEHIQSIRRDYGAGGGLDSTGQMIVNNLEDVIKGSLERLSTDLYSEQGHFVLELIQNADDNEYQSVKPTLCFIVSPEEILVCNNELGFKPENIKAICSVNRSTKGQHKQGYAGHKGIGFKSVFMVSDRPEIHSRNYHIRFETKDANGKTDQMGYIRPIWIDQLAKDLPNPQEWITTIRLPIKADTGGDGLKQKFDNISSRLLLFLNRLRQIEIISQHETNMIKKTFSRIDHADGKIIELQEQRSDRLASRNLWLVVKKVIKVPDEIKNKLHDMKGVVNQTTIAIAYPLQGIEQTPMTLPDRQPLFAYLPLCSYGFRFILQADFEIPANRQDICRDNLWNDWLRSEMASLIYLAYLQFQQLPDLLSSLNIQFDEILTPIQVTKFFIKLLPFRPEITPYFHPFVDRSFTLLSGVIKLPVSSLTDQHQDEIHLASPSQCFLVRDPAIRQLLPQDLISSHFHSYYVHEDLVKDCEEKVLLRLGCRLLECWDITQLMETSYQSDGQEHQKTESTIKDIAQWLICLDYSLQQNREQTASDTSHKKKSEETIQKLKQLKILPLRTHSRLVSIDEFERNTILFPLNKSTKYPKELRLVLDEIPILDERLLNFIEDQHPGRLVSIRKLLEKLGIKETPRIQDIYRQHMLPNMAEQSRWTTKSADVLVAYLICIYRYLYLPDRSLSEQNWNQLRSTLLIKTCENEFLSLGTESLCIHLTETYGCRRTLESLVLPNRQFQFISDDYIIQYRDEVFRNDMDKHTFRGFLQQLNINDFLHIKFSKIPFADVSQLGETPWKNSMEKLNELIHEPFFINDYSSNEFETFISSNATYDFYVQLFQYLHDHYHSTSTYYSASIVKARDEKIGRLENVCGVESSFCLALRQHCWIPASDGKLYKPADVYYFSTQNRAFQQYLPHLDTKILALKDEDFVFSILGIQRDIALRTMFELLMQLSCGLDKEALWDLIQSSESLKTIPCTLPSNFRRSCSESLDNIRNVYLFLLMHEETRILLQRFCQWPLVFLPKDHQSGHFVFVQQVYWHDQVDKSAIRDILTNATGRYAIESHYKDNSQLLMFFIELLHVEYQPTIDDYLPLLSQTKDDLEQLWTIIVIITSLAIEQNKEAEVQEKSRDISFIPCSKREEFMKYTDRPLYPDIPNIVKLFTDVVPIIQLPEFQLSNEFQKNFCFVFNLKPLSQVIKTNVQVTNEQVSMTLTNFYRQSIDLIQEYLLNKKYLSEIRSKELASVFKDMRFVCVDSIELSYSYGTISRQLATGSSINDTYIDENAAKFYILKKFEHSELRYVDAMVTFLVENVMHRSSLSTYIKQLIMEYQNDSEQGLNKIREQLTMTFEPKWMISFDLPKIVKRSKVEEKKITEMTKVTEEERQGLIDLPSLRPTFKPTDNIDDQEKPNPLSIPPLNPLTRKINDQGSTSEHQSRQDHSFEQDQVVSDGIYRRINDDASETLVNFEDIPLSNMSDFDLATLKLSEIDDVPTVLSDSDRQTGYQGEWLVFHLLKSYHSNAEITWHNIENESGKPYDIFMKLPDGTAEYIEVKTTRTANQQTFFISINEIKFFLENPSNYSIYRVYYADQIHLSKVTKINKIEENLEQKRLKLSISVISKFD